MDTHEVIDALRHLISSLHLDTVAGAAIAGTVLAGGLYVARLGIRRRRSAAAVAHERPSPVHMNEFDGTETLFVMPDITGYTKLLSAAGRNGAAQVNEAVIMLLDALMQSAKGRLTVAKLEGDAILFFAEADKLTPNDLGDILLDLFRAFDATRQRLALDGALPSTLSELDLKVVVHCGHAERFTFRNAIDLIGSDVVLTYRLLKSGLKQRRYILSTSNASERFMLPDNYTRQHLRKHIPEFGDTGLVLIDMPREDTVPREQRQTTRQTSRLRLFQSKRALTAQ